MKLNGQQYSKPRLLAAAGLATSLLVPAFVSQAAAAKDELKSVNTWQQAFAEGSSDGYLRMLDYANHNGLFLGGSDSNSGNQHSLAIGGGLGFTTAQFHGFSLRLSAFAQRNITNDENRFGEAIRDLQDDEARLGEAYIQWQGLDWQDYNLRVRAGNQKISNDVPFTGTYDYRIIPQTYQGVKARYGNDDRYLMAMRMFRYQSRTSDGYKEQTNYNNRFVPGVNNSKETDGFWAIGGADKEEVGDATLTGKAWFMNYKDYANMYFAQGKIAKSSGSIKPYAAVQVIHEEDTGDAYLGKLDNEAYGLRIGAKRNSLNVNLNYDYISNPGAGANFGGGLVTPYSHAESSGPLFAQPLVNSTQDLGYGNAYSVNVKGSPMANTFAGVRYSFMDLTSPGYDESKEQSEYLAFAIYHFQGALEGISVANFFSYQTRNHGNGNNTRDYFENRFSLSYSF